MQWGIFAWMLLTVEWDCPKRSRGTSSENSHNSTRMNCRKEVHRLLHSSLRYYPSTSPVTFVEGGSGLGLWISRHIVHMHKVVCVQAITCLKCCLDDKAWFPQGFMGVTSAGRGHGSTFFFELPVYGPDYSPPQPQPLSQTQPPSQPQPQQLPPNPSSHVAGLDIEHPLPLRFLIVVNY